MSPQTTQTQQTSCLLMTTKKEQLIDEIANADLDETAVTYLQQELKRLNRKIKGDKQKFSMKITDETESVLEKFNVLGEK